MSEIDDLKELGKLIVSGQRPGTQGIERANQSEVCPSVCAPSKMEDVSADARMWAVAGDSYIACEQAVGSLPSGHYTIDSSMDRGIFFRSMPMNTDNLIRLPDSASDEVIREIDEFWTLEKHFRKYGFLWKRGILLWGPAGSGKTSTVQIVCDQMVKDGHLTIYVSSPSLACVGLKLLRKIEPKRHLMVVLEDIDAIVRHHGESDLLSLVDGEHQVDNVIYVATTNYPELLDKRLVNRPSRFDVVKKIGMPDRGARKVYLLAKSDTVRKSSQKLERWLDETEGFSVAHLKELIISVEVFQRDFECSVLRLRTMMECNSSSADDDRPQMGFKNSSLIPEWKSTK